MIKPLFKWAGGKRKMLARYEATVMNPEALRCEVFVDMFAGAGIMSLWAYQNRETLGLKKIIFNDLNDELIHMFRCMKEDVELFIYGCEKLQEDYFKAGEEKEDRKRVYLSWRDEYADSGVSGMSKACLLFCMLKTNFNGIWQSRAVDGTYYTPFGTGKEVKHFIDPDQIREFKEMLGMAEITCLSFEETDKNIDNPETAFFYADPPYLASFTKYKKKAGEFSFGLTETENLVGFLHGQAEKGSKFALSNKDHEFFKGFTGITHFYNIKYTASAKDTEAATSTEILWSNL